jgi:hypothetical protein
MVRFGENEYPLYPTMTVRVAMGASDIDVLLPVLDKTDDMGINTGREMTF